MLQKACARTYTHTRMHAHMHMRMHTHTHHPLLCSTHHDRQLGILSRSGWAKDVEVEAILRFVPEVHVVAMAAARG